MGPTVFASPDMRRADMASISWVYKLGAMTPRATGGPPSPRTSHPLFVQPSTAGRPKRRTRPVWRRPPIPSILSILSTPDGPLLLPLPPGHKSATSVFAAIQGRPTRNNNNNTTTTSWDTLYYSIPALSTLTPTYISHQPPRAAGNYNHAAGRAPFPHCCNSFSPAFFPGRAVQQNVNVCLLSRGPERSRDSTSSLDPITTSDPGLFDPLPHHQHLQLFQPIPDLPLTSYRQSSLPSSTATLRLRPVRHSGCSADFQLLDFNYFVSL
ncbi:hypothetical protein K461DRAFT_315111, partial [Myriangium duriaei CBS 260.36]